MLLQVQEAQQVVPDGNSARKAAAEASKAKTAVAKQAGRKAGDRPGEFSAQSSAIWHACAGDVDATWSCTVSARSSCLIICAESAIATQIPCLQVDQALRER